MQGKKKFSFWRMLLKFFLYSMLYSVLVMILTLFLDAIHFNGDSQAFICLLLPLAVLIIVPRLWKKAPEYEAKKFSKNSNKEEVKIPMTAKGHEAVVNDLLATVSLYVSLANNTKFFSTFIDYYDTIIDALKSLRHFEGKYDFSKVMKYSTPTLELYRFEKDFQWHLRDAIEEQGDRIIADAKDKYRNNKTQTRLDCQSFKDDIVKYYSRFDDETAKLSEKKLRELQQKFDVQLLEDIPSPSTSNVLDTSPYLQYGGVDAELNNVDLMEGHAFEGWCADLLCKNGYQNVSVTPGSGDQGIDVLAEKNGVKFAIQCKCYSSDLGNTPVQEAHAGKDFYNCDVAVVMTNQHFTKGAKELAEKTRTRLWDRDTLKSMLETQLATTT